MVCSYRCSIRAVMCPVEVGSATNLFGSSPSNAGLPAAPVLCHIRSAPTAASGRSAALLVQPCGRVDELAVGAAITNLEMQMRPGAHARGTDVGDVLGTT